MRPALQRLLTSPSALSLLRLVVHSERYRLCQIPPVKARRQEHTWRPFESHRPRDMGRRDASGTAQVTGDEGADEFSQETRLVEFQEPLKVSGNKADSSFLEGLTLEELEPPVAAQNQEQNISRTTQILDHMPIAHEDSWKPQMLTFEQCQHQSDLEERLADIPKYAADWALWLELVRFRNRHYGLRGARVIFKEIFDRGLQLPIEKKIGNELWDMLLQSGFEDTQWLQEIVAYAVELRRTTEKCWARLYGSIVGHTLQLDQGTALRWHLQLKEDFPPTVEDYRYLFNNSIAGNTIAQFMALYRDLPVIGMYATVVLELCKLQRYREAMKWHNLLCVHKDLPQDFNDIKPLLVYLAQTGDDRQTERVCRRLYDVQDWQSSIPRKIREYVGEKEVLSRELMNRQLGEIHGVAPKQLTDGFCARLFATKLIGVNTIISGLQMMAVETIGPLSLREMASRDRCDPATICQRLGRLKDAGVSLDKSIFSIVLEKLAREGQRRHRLLKSVVECDLHPDTFEDLGLQERLLPEYYEKNDNVQIERTLTIITHRCTTEKHRDVRRWNVILRAHVTLRKADMVFSMLSTMQRKDIVLSARSSRHMRCEWLSERQRGYAAQNTQELSVLIKASCMSMQSGQYVPIIAWREIMRRLGMAGRLIEYENLTLWLTDFYLGISAPPSLQDFELPPITDKVPQAEADELARNSNPNSPLKILLLNYAALQATVTWGFLHEVRTGPANIKRGQRNLRNATQPQDWRWGLKLLFKVRERGVPIQKAAIARICRLRLEALFGSGVSNRPINREAKWANDVRARADYRYRKAYYIRAMEKIWGKDLFRHQGQILEWRVAQSDRREIEAVEGPLRWRRKKVERGIVRKCYFEY